MRAGKVLQINQLETLSQIRATDVQVSEYIMREELIQSVLSDLNGGSADIEASAIISTDGLTIASALSSAMDEARVGAMAAAMLSLGERTATELARGDLEQVMIKGNNGYVLLIHAGPEAVLSVIVRKEARLGLVFLDASRAAKAAGELL
ncbi:Roadblock/LC7 family protein [Acidithiobacillus ferrivorans]|uniref:Roadblock/LC7 family protein n=2 Tax=Acidithiobacillus ferrivorans TaxID=160808 RepID=A0A060UKA8_9PROT|nr:Roadblock/LC7 family protein [Acidithiobacillus ferrivorans]SMH63994.1 Roadblock/LC7 family protein [Acidithiobacillus ferrivorans]